jgi:hypothetical protein
VRLNTTNVVPDVVISMRWYEERNENGIRGLVLADNGTRGKGTHGSLGPCDMHNTMIANGPDFKRGFVDPLPTGSVDIAPTIQWLFGIATSLIPDGRVVHEALVHGEEEVPRPEPKLLEASREHGWFSWRQYLKYTKMGNTIYLDEGNGGMSVAAPERP